MAELVSVVLLLVLVALAVRFVLRRPEREERIDPFALSEPWRHYVRDAVQAHKRFSEAVRRAQEGPMQERLLEIDHRVRTGVREVWRIAQRADDLVDARRRADPDAIRKQIAAGSPEQSVIDALEAQLGTIERLDLVIRDSDQRLRVLNARLDEAAVRTIELSVGTGDTTGLLGLGATVDDVVGEMEALRLAIEETGAG